MTFYQQLNHFVELIEQNLDTGVAPSALAKQVDLPFTMLQKVFPLLSGMPLSEYIRGRKLTLAGKDLVQTNLRVVDIAYQYGYESAEAFSRAFHKFHHLMPSEVRHHPGSLRSLAKLAFVAPTSARDITYEVVELPQLELYGIGIRTDNSHVNVDAPQLFQNVATQHPELPHPDYGVLRYASGRDDANNYYYYVLWRQSTLPFAQITKQIIPASRWLKFHIHSQESVDIQRESKAFYEEFLPTCSYLLRDEPDLEYYHDGITDFLIPIN